MAWGQGVQALQEYRHILCRRYYSRRLDPRHGEIVTQCFRRRNLGLGGLYVLGFEPGQPEVPLADPGIQESGQKITLLRLGRRDGLHLLDGLLLGAGRCRDHLSSGAPGDAALEGHDLPVEGIYFQLVLDGILAGGLGGTGMLQYLLFLLFPFLNLELGGDRLAGIVIVRWPAGEPG